MNAFLDEELGWEGGQWWWEGKVGRSSHHVEDRCSKRPLTWQRPRWVCDPHTAPWNAWDLWEPSGCGPEVWSGME